MPIRVKIFVLLLAVCQCVMAQEDVSFGHFWALQSFYNPAATAVDAQLDARAVYSNQLSGFENCPKTLFAGADLPIYFLSPAHSAGVSLVNDQSGFFKHTRIALQYAYHHKFGNNLKVSGGLRFALLSESFDASGVDVIDASDPVIGSGSLEGSAFDLDFGLRVDYKKLWYAGVSMLHLTAPTVEYADEKIYQFNMASTFYLTGGYNIKFRTPLFNMQLDAIVRTNLTAWRGDLAARMFYNGEKHHLYFGAGYSPLNSATVLVGGDFHGVTIGYSYEVYTSSIGFIHGSHEVSVGYKADLDLFKKGRNLHKSVRYL